MAVNLRYFFLQQNNKSSKEEREGEVIERSIGLFRYWAIGFKSFIPGVVRNVFLQFYPKTS